MCTLDRCPRHFPFFYFFSFYAGSRREKFLSEREKIKFGARNSLLLFTLIPVAAPGPNMCGGQTSRVDRKVNEEYAFLGKKRRPPLLCICKRLWRKKKKGRDGWKRWRGERERKKAGRSSGPFFCVSLEKHQNCSFFPNTRPLHRFFYHSRDAQDRFFLFFRLQKIFRPEQNW